MRQPLIVGNWKMHGSRDSVALLLEGLVARCEASDACEIAVCPAHLHVQQALQLCADSPISVGGQDCSAHAAGAYTGEVSASMLADLGCRWVVLGHSERRQYHGESDTLIAAKIGAAIAAGLQPIVCVGETQQEREAGHAEEVVANQIRGALEGQVDASTVVVAYEPVWAIGTGLTATPDQAQDMHAFIRDTLAGVVGVGIEASSVRLLYGGSVKPENAEALFSQQDIDGALVGGAALEVESFAAIVEAARI